jgi:hypothetical protein
VAGYMISQYRGIVGVRLPNTDVSKKKEGSEEEECSKEEADPKSC